MGLAPGLLPGRVRLDDARSWYHDGGWAQQPASTGLDAAGILDAAANGKIDVLVLLGADPLNEVPDRELATRGLAGARTVIALDGFLTDSAAQADVVLASAGFAELDGTTTNLEGRVSTVARKITPPGTARAPWMVAAELARLVGSDLGLTSVPDIQAEIEALAPSHAGLTSGVLAGPAAHDGVVVPITGPLPGVGAAHGTDSAAGDAGGDLVMESAAASGSAEHMEGVPSQPGHGSPTDPDHDPGTVPPVEAGTDADVEAPTSAPADDRPALLTYEPGPVAAVPAVDGYSLRLVATRKLYDRGVLTQRSPSLAPLAPAANLRLHPHDFDRVGVTPGTSVTLSSARGSAHIPVVPDEGVPRGSAVVHINQPGAEVSAVIDASAQVIDVRVVP
jgi:predicted molibdopterin-dependent oxidoreductase YjgC